MRKETVLIVKMVTNMLIRISKNVWLQLRGVKPEKRQRMENV